MNYYKRIGETTEGKKPVIKGWIYPETYEYSIDYNSELSTIKEWLCHNHLWQPVTKEEYEQWAIDKAKELYPVGTVITSLYTKDDFTIESNEANLDQKNVYIFLDNSSVYNLETGEWAEIVSKPEEWGEEAELLKLTTPMVEQLKEIPEARKLLEECGLIEIDYVKEVINNSTDLDNISDFFLSIEKEPYSKLTANDICKALVQYVKGFERDKE